MVDPFETVEDIIDEVADESEEQEAKRERREKQKFFVVKVETIFESQKELREWLEKNEETAKDYRIVKGFEILPKKKVAYYF
jgi:DNA-binding transcriptional regulator GbsR (MarR family)